jgi:short-subunit dehydrogenase
MPGRTRPYKAALVTGATSGIGRAFAEILEPETDLLLTGRDRAALDALARSLARPGRRVETVAADLALPEGIAAVGAAAEAFGIDLLVNNAGLGRFGRLVDNPEAAEHAMIAVNVIAPLVLTRALLPGMLARAEATGTRAGVIVVASIVGFGPIAYFTTYAATKAFDLHFAAGLAAEMKGEPVDVLALCPGTTATAFFERANAPQQPSAHSPERVAKEGLAALGRKTVHVVGATNRLLSFALRYTPLGLLAAGTAMAMRRRAPD